MNELQNFTNGIFNLDIKVENGDILFSAEQVAKSLGLTTVAKSGNEVVRWSRVSKYLSQRVRKIDLISEPMVYKLAFKANNAVSEKFTDWLAVEVLPTIRKHGAYMTDAKLEEALLNPDTLINLATQLKDERGKRLIAEQRVNELQPKADYYDKILNNKGLSTVSVLAKNYGMSATKFNHMLHKFKIQYKQGETWLLYAPHQAKGYTHSEPFDFTDGDGNKKVSYTMKWTQKGHMFLYEFLKKKNILPIIEQDDLAS